MTLNRPRKLIEAKEARSYELSLTLLVLGIRWTDDVQTAVTAHAFALRAARTDRGMHLHGRASELLASLACSLFSDVRRTPEPRKLTKRKALSLSLHIQPLDDAAMREVVWRELDDDPIARQNANPVHAHAAGNVREHFVRALNLNPEHGIREVLLYRARQLDRVLFGHALDACGDQGRVDAKLLLEQHEPAGGPLPTPHSTKGEP